jgi:hypothetical protein
MMSCPKLQRRGTAECDECHMHLMCHRRSPLDWVRRYDGLYSQRYYLLVPWLLTAVGVLAVITCGQLFDLFTGRI